MAWVAPVAAAAGSLIGSKMIADSASGAAGVSDKAAKRQYALSREMLDEWKNTVFPYQQGLTTRALSLYDEAQPTEADYAREIGSASGDVARAFGRARDATSRHLLSYGADPSSGRFQSLMIGLQGQQAAAEAAARNSARIGLRDTGFSRQAQALNLAGALNAPNYTLLGQGVSQFNAAAGNQINAANTRANLQAQMASSLGRGLGYGLSTYNPGSGGGGNPATTYDPGDGGGTWDNPGFADGGENDMMSRYRRSSGRVSREMAGAMGLREKFMGKAERVDRPGLSAMEQIRGEVRGPGTPISDDIPVATEEGEEARLADGEVVMPTDTTAAIGMSFYRADPEAAMHKLGVAVLEEIIDETHVPAEVQREQGLSVDPRGVEDGAHDDERVGYADGGQSGWGLGLSMLGHGLANAYSRGGWLEGVRSGERSARQAEEAEFQRSQRERMLEEQARQDEYRKASEQAIADAIQFTGGDVMDPEFGVTAQTGDPSMVGGLRMALPDQAKANLGLRMVKAKYDPSGYLADVAATDEAQAKRDWEREKLDLQHQYKLEENKRLARSGGTGGEPADVVMARMYQADRGGKLSDWLDHVRSGRYSPEQLAMDYANRRLKEQAGAFVRPEDPEYITREQAVEEGFQMANRLREMRMPADEKRAKGAEQKKGAADKGGDGKPPAGIPKGSRQIGTSGGKPVYEAPNGKRYIVE